MIDEISIKKQVIWDSAKDKFNGYVDISAGNCE